MARLTPVLAGLALLAASVAAQANGFGIRPRVAVGYYYPVPVTYVPVVPYNPCPLQGPPAYVTESTAPPSPTRAVPPARPQAQPGTRFAPTTPAPPSSGPASPEPPLANPPRRDNPVSPAPGRQPSVSESRSYYDSYAVAPRAGDLPAGDHCSVGFWNLSGQDLIVHIDGKARTLERGRKMLLDVGRQFEWQVDGREPHKENIATGEQALEIVVRR
jgi:hypothetical protein